MKTYHKINSVFMRDEKTAKFLRDQYARPEFEYLRWLDWVWTEKLDGTNVRVGWSADGEFRYAGRTEEASMPPYLLEVLKAKLPEAKVREVFPDPTIDICLYGEGIGQKIQAVGKHYVPGGHDFVLFDIRVGHWWLKREAVESTARLLGVRVAPIVGRGNLENALLKCYTPFKSQLGDLNAEGLVCRLDPELLDRGGQRIITKIKTKDLLKGWA